MSQVYLVNFVFRNMPSSTRATISLLELKRMSNRFYYVKHYEFSFASSSGTVQCAASSFHLARASQPLCHHHNHKLRRSSSSPPPLLFFHSPSPFPSATQTDRHPIFRLSRRRRRNHNTRVVAQCVYDARTFRAAAAAAAFPLDIELRQR